MVIKEDKEITCRTSVRERRVREPRHKPKRSSLFFSCVFADAYSSCACACMCASPSLLSMAHFSAALPPSPASYAVSLSPLSLFSFDRIPTSSRRTLS